MKVAMMIILFLSFALAGFGIGFTLSEKGKPKTNGDRIRAMTEEELAKFLMDANDCVLHIPFCRNKSECLNDMMDINEDRCMECMMEWIKQPVEVE